MLIKKSWKLFQGDWAFAPSLSLLYLILPLPLPFSTDYANDVPVHLLYIFNGEKIVEKREKRKRREKSAQMDATYERTKRQVCANTECTPGEHDRPDTSTRQPHAHSDADYLLAYMSTIRHRGGSEGVRRVQGVYIFRGGGGCFSQNDLEWVV